ncbi:hypothetical protein H9P43_009080 [Blastocladiella emersonii ATCC 22665]|nr:hypothetical protein H9P43_009080 [Blastocladiella emersonii ATCC 22665]
MSILLELTLITHTTHRQPVRVYLSDARDQVRHIAVHVLRPTAYPRPATGVDTRRPRFESWTFCAPSIEAAHDARRLLRQWLAVDRARDATYLAIVNPHVGKRRASRILRTIVEPMLALAMVGAETVVTRGRMRAFEVARDTDLAAYRGALIVGGDGVVHEFFNGLLARTDDRDAALQFPVAHVAAGTGNGLAASLNAVPAEYAVLAALNEWTQPIDVLDTRHCFPSPSPPQPAAHHPPAHA